MIRFRVFLLFLIQAVSYAAFDELSDGIEFPVQSSGGSNA
jgi:hypothetical protein